ncbi:chaperone protein DnaJ [compost metagenome]
MSEPDFYEVLQVHPKASPLIIKKAYRTLLLAGTHPDKGGNSEQTHLLTEAYRVLSDPALRDAYDRQRNPAAGSGPALIVAICSQCGTYNRVRSETGLLVARCGRCKKPIGKPKLPGKPRTPLPPKAIAIALMTVLLLAGGGFAYWLWHSTRDPLQRAMTLEDRGDPAAAIALLKPLSTPAALKRLGRLYEEEGLLAEAQTTYETLLAKEPSPHAYVLLGSLHLKRENLAAAERHLKEATRLDPGNPTALTLLADAYVKDERYDEAVGYYRRAMPLDPSNAELPYRLGMLHQINRDPDQALAAYRKALTLNPRHRAALIQLGTLLSERGDASNALTQFERAAVLGYEDADLHFRIAALYLRLGDSTPAIREFEVAFRQAERDPLLRERIAKALSALGAQPPQD